MPIALSIYDTHCCVVVAMTVPLPSWHDIAVASVSAKHLVPGMYLIRYKNPSHTTKRKILLHPTTVVLEFFLGDAFRERER